MIRRGRAGATENSSTFVAADVSPLHLLENNGNNEPTHVGCYDNYEGFLLVDSAACL